ncbi:hypothetical protein IWX89_001453 [Cryobacterium sp. MP_M3]|uniref:hypothetical protein n=1 Tax=unclassified Cryobacterium TaxID=2649013 RepID=UPI0018C942F5|nr:MULTISPECIES: hypothetical protein [unclassified Cryobacterium]MBG6058015.1 hypothetical protein [Cryobacterium sp. MP_M3]
MELSVHRTRDEAVGVAFADVTRDGGWLTVHYSDGAVESQQEYPAMATAPTVPTDAASPAGSDQPRPGGVGASPFAPEFAPGFAPSTVALSLVPSFADDRDVDAEPPDSRLGHGLDLLGVAGFVGIPLVSGVYSPEMLAAAPGAPWLLYSVSFSGALGFALLAVALSFGLQARLGELVSALLCFGLSGYIAGEIGVGGLGSALEQGGSLLESLGTMLTSALHAYGPGGAVATAAVGVFFGWRLARHLPGSLVNRLNA